MNHGTKTNAARILDQWGIAYTLYYYTVNEDRLGAEHVAQSLGMDVEVTVKTLVLRGDKTGIMVACLPGYAAIDLKKLASSSGNKKVDMVPVKEVVQLTGYLRGGVSPIGMKKQYPLYVDELVFLQEKVLLSAGLRGVQFFLDPAPFFAKAQGIVVDIAQ